MTALVDVFSRLTAAAPAILIVVGGLPLAPCFFGGILPKPTETDRIRSVVVDVTVTSTACTNGAMSQARVVRRASEVVGSAKAWPLNSFQMKAPARVGPPMLLVSRAVARASAVVVVRAAMVRSPVSTTLPGIATKASVLSETKLTATL